MHNVSGDEFQHIGFELYILLFMLKPLSFTRINILIDWLVIWMQLTFKSGVF